MYMYVQLCFVRHRSVKYSEREKRRAMINFEWRKSYISLQYIHQCSFWSDHDEHRKLWMARDRLIIFMEEKHPLASAISNLMQTCWYKIVIYPAEQIHRKIVINWCVEVQEPNVLGKVFPTDLNRLFLFRKQIFLLSYTQFSRVEK